MEHINADDVIAFFLDLMDKIQWVLIETRSCAIFSWTNWLDRFSGYLKGDEGLTFCLVDKKLRIFVD